MRTIMRLLFRDSKGATAIEYGLIVALIVIAMMAALQSFAGTSTSMFSLIEQKVSAGSTP